MMKPRSWRAPPTPRDDLWRSAFARSSRWTSSAESELTALRHVKALVQVLGQRRGQDAFRRGAVIIVEIQQRLRGDGNLEVDQLLAVILHRAVRRLVFVDRGEHLGERSVTPERPATKLVDDHGVESTIPKPDGNRSEGRLQPQGEAERLVHFIPRL